MEELNQTKGLLNTAINHTTDNPIVNTEAKNDRWYSNAEVLDEMRAGKPTVYVNSCSNFDNTQLALQMESLTKALGQVMHISAWRTTQLVDDHRTGLSTYLVAKENKGGDGFANIAQSMSGLYADGTASSATVFRLPSVLKKPSPTLTLLPIVFLRWPTSVMKSMPMRCSTPHRLWI